MMTLISSGDRDFTLSATPSEERQQQVVGRTGYDVLAGSKLFILLIFLFVLAMACLIMWPDAVVSAVNSAISVASDNSSFLIPIVLGWWCGRYIFRRWIQKDIIILVEPLKEPSYCVRMSDSTFARYTRKNGLLNPEPTISGRVMYRAKSIDFENCLIDGGWIHERKTSPGLVFTRKSKYYDFLEGYRKARERVLELTDTPFVEGTDYGMRFVRKNIELQESVIFGDSVPDVSEIESELPDPDVVVIEGAASDD